MQRPAERAPWWSARRRGELVPVRLTHGAIEVPAYVASGVNDGPILTVLACVHGDEYVGPMTIAELLADLPVSNMTGTVLAVPVVNAAAYLAATRESPVDGKNLARIFPGDAQGTPTEQIAYLVTMQCIAPADVVIDLHAGNIDHDVALLVGYGYAGDEVGARSGELARAFGAPVVWEHPEIAPGRTGSVAQEWGIPWLYTEAPVGGTADPTVVRAFKQGVERVMVALHMLPGPPPAPRHTQFWRGAGDADEMAPASTAGLFRSRVTVGSEVALGDPIGEILDPAGQVLERFVAPRRGVVWILRRIPRVLPGDLVYLLTDRVDSV